MSEETGGAPVVESGGEAEAQVAEAIPGRAERKRAALQGQAGRREPTADAALADEVEDGGVDLDPDDVDALSSDAPADTVRIGDHDVPIGLLQAALGDEGLMRRLTRKLKVDGEEVEVSLDEALRAVPLAKSAHARMRQAAEQRKQLEAIVQQMKTDPVGVMERVLGSTDPIYDAVMRRLEYEGMSPEDRARVDEERELRAKAARADEYESQREAERAKAETARLQQSYSAMLGEAFKASGVRESPYATRRAASMLQDVVSQDTSRALTREDFEWAAQQVARELSEERDSSLPGDADGEALIEAVGIERAKKIARAMAQRVRSSQRTPERPAQAGRPSPAVKKPATWDEFFEQRNRSMGIRR